jgi:hypothetical protein
VFVTAETEFGQVDAVCAGAGVFEPVSELRILDIPQFDTSLGF